MTNRQKILTDRQQKFKTGNHQFNVGNLVFKRNEVDDNIAFPKSMPSQKDLFMIVHIPQKKNRDSKVNRVTDSSFKVYIRNLRTGIESSAVASNLRLVKANELADFNFNILKELNAQVKRLGQISQNRDLGLTLLGLEGSDKDDVEDQVDDSADQEGNLVSHPGDHAKGYEDEHQLGARPKRVAAKPKQFDDYETYSITFLETQFMSLNSIQRQSVVKGLRLHLDICEKNCSNHDLFKYLIEIVSKLNHFYEALPLACNKYKKNKGLKVKFSNFVTFLMETLIILNHFIFV